MNRPPLTYYLSDKNRLSEISDEQIESWIREAPYCQPLRMMLAQKRFMDLKQLEDVSLTVASTYSANRRELYQQIHGAYVEDSEPAPGAVAESVEETKSFTSLTEYEEVMIVPSIEASKDILEPAEITEDPSPIDKPIEATQVNKEDNKSESTQEVREVIEVPAISSIQPIIEKEEIETLALGILPIEIDKPDDIVINSQDSTNLEEFIVDITSKKKKKKKKKNTKKKSSKKKDKKKSKKVKKDKRKRKEDKKAKKKREKKKSKKGKSGKRKDKKSSKKKSSKKGKKKTKAKADVYIDTISSASKVGRRRDKRKSSRSGYTTGEAISITDGELSSYARWLLQFKQKTNGNNVTNKRSTQVKMDTSSTQITASEAAIIKTQQKSKKKKKRKSKREITIEKASKSVKIKDEAISEAWADLLAQQGHLKKARKMYAKLSLKYPEKSTYFAAKLDKFKKNT